jgi:hypothetical protein
MITPLNLPLTGETFLSAEDSLKTRLSPSLIREGFRMGYHKFLKRARRRGGCPYDSIDAFSTYRPIDLQP